MPEMLCFKKKNMYRCEPCCTSFNGIIPYQGHMVSEKHRKKTEALSNKRVTAEPVTTSSSMSDPYIEQFCGEYKCSLCCTVLNSRDQVLAHIIGRKHKKNMIGKGVLPNSSYLSQPTAIGTESYAINQYSFIFHNIKIEDPLSNVKIFNVDEPIVF